MPKSDKEERNRKRMQRALPAWEIVKKDILDSRRKANYWFSIYRRYTNYGLNQFRLDLYFARFTSEILNLYYQLEPKLQKWGGYDDVLKIGEAQETDKTFTKQEWVHHFRRINNFIEDIGISDVSMGEMVSIQREE